VIPLALVSPHRSGYWDLVRPALENIAIVSEFAFDADVSIDAFARRVMAAMPPRFAAIGACMGGYAVFEILRIDSRRLDGIALIGTSPSPDPAWRRADRERRIKQLRHKVALGLSLSEGGAQQILPWMLGRDALIDPQVSARARTALAGLDAQGMLAQQCAVAERQPSAWPLEYWGDRALVMIGDEDRMCSREDANLVAVALTGHPAQLAARCGHMVAIERPDRFIELTCGWLRALSRSAVGDLCS
jgi:pimeloyl-ACP methyl ester carboxylesterase